MEKRKSKDKGKGKGREWEVRENARNWVPDEAGGRERFNTQNRQGREPLYSDLPGLRNSAMLQRDDQQRPYASDGEGRQYEYVVRQAMPQGGKFKDGEGNKYRESWQYVGQTPEERQYRGDDSFIVGGDDVWQRVITPIQKAPKQQPAAAAAAPTAAAAAPAVPGALPPGQAPLQPSSSYVQPGETSTRVTPGRQFLESYMRNEPFELDLSSAYASYNSGNSAFSSGLTSLQPIGSNDGRAWYDRLY